MAPETELDPLEVEEETSEPRLGYGTMNFIAGTVGGFMGVLTGQPFDTVKVRSMGSAPGQSWRNRKQRVVTDAWGKGA
jgi:hypothetical protein